jgi:uncharacterized protein (DUF1778 family)
MSPKTTGRPKMSDSEKKMVRLEIRLTHEENELLTRLSERMKLSKTDTILKAVRFLAEQN